MSSTSWNLPSNGKADIAQVYASEIIIKDDVALAGVAQWTEYRPMNQRVTGLIPNQSTCLGCGPGPQWWVCKRQPHIGVSLPLFLPPSPQK